VHPGVVIAGGLLLSASRCLVLARTGPDTAVAWLLAGTVVVYLGVGPSTALGTELVVGAAPPHRAGATAAVSESAVELNSALGVAVVGSLSAAVYRAEIALPADLSAPQAHRATDSIAGAVVFTGLAALAVTTLRRTAPARGPGRTG
jgi:DHA2 family multidrug resistance protein-like MFS transporter